MFKLRIDLWLAVPALLLSLLGLLVIRSVAPSLFGDQFLFFIVSVGLFLLFSALDYQIIFSLYIPAYISSILFLTLPYFFGLYSRGAVRWIPLGSFSLQPSEVVKPFLLAAFAAIAVTSSAQKRLPVLLLSGLLPMFMIFRQPDLGTALVVMAGWSVIFLSRAPLKQIVPLLILVPLLAVPVYKYVLHDYQRQRLITFVNPYADPLGKGYHVIQSVIAVGSGGIFGRGLGQGTQSQLRFLPERHTDFIFASLSEELGFAGAFFVIALFAMLLRRIYRISQGTNHRMASLYCVGIVSMLMFQIFVNIGMNIGIAPVTGITLPFLSYGGSSMASLAVLLGIVNSISSDSRDDHYLQIS